MSLLALLRSGTSSRHELLDAEISRYPLTERYGYARFLLMHGRALPALEAWLACSGIDGPRAGPATQLRTGALQSDLAELGFACPSAPEAPLFRRNPSMPGVRYVLEGSRLGAAYIGMQLTQAGVEFPTRFIYHGYGQPFWKNFVKWLAEQDAGPREAERAVETARNVFDTYLMALEYVDDQARELSA